ncbi:hypothetical protein V2A60_008577 [Cordyceps javanica]
MTPPFLALLSLFLALAIRSAWAQEGGAANQVTSTSSKVWAAVAFINHGDTTPFLLRSHPALTPDGAQQLYRQGKQFRSRYLAPPATAKNGTSDAAPIQGMRQDGIDNTQLRILSQTDEWVVGGALAFTQALYPAFNATAAGESVNRSTYPLGGYQYPQIETLAVTDANSIGLQGHVGCPTWQNAATTNLTTNPALKAAAQDSADFYAKLFSSGPLKGALPADEANFFNAYDIYNLVRWTSLHNASAFAGQLDINATLTRLAADAFTMARAKSDPGSSSANDTAGVTLTVAGRTLAKLITDELSRVANQTTGSTYGRMTLLFGSFQPLMALFSIAGLLTRDNVMSTRIGNVTAPGAAIVFELVGQDPTNANSLPKHEDLSVRFVYRPTADESDTFQVFSLFGSGNGGQTIPYLAFRDKMYTVGRDAADWCQICKPGAENKWCQGVLSSAGAGAGAFGRSQMSPALAGVIGALIMGALIAMAIFALCGLGGLRLRRRDGDSDANGAEKRDPDHDVRYGSGGDPQERVGSWEMRGQPQGQTRHGGVQQQRNPFDDDAGSDVDGAVPVKAREGF